MKINVRLLLLALLAAVSVCATAAASASASEFLIEGQQVTTGTNVEGTTGLSLLKATVLGVKVSIECPEGTFTGKIEAGGKGEGDTFVLKKCKETAPAKCSVAETLESKLDAKLIGTAPEAEFEPLTPEGNFFEFSITGAECAVKNTYKVTGTQACELPKSEEELVEHEIVCPATKSKLKVVGVSATFSTTSKIKLTSGKKWSTTGLTAGKLLSVDYRGNQPILIDHLKNTAYRELEGALKISEYGAGNEVEWEADRTGAVKKIWIPVYELGKKVKLEAQFSVETATKEYLEAHAEEVELKGETTVAGGAFSFTRKLNAAQIKLQLEDHSGYLTTEVLDASAALLSKVTKASMAISWKWSVKETGRPNPIVQNLGTNTNTIYTIYSAPVNNALLYLTLLDVATEGISQESEPLNESKLIASVWRGFSNKQKEAGCLTLECPIFRLRVYNPTTGAITTGNPILYYEPAKTGLNLTEYKLGKPTYPFDRFLVVQLLEALTGECGAWARAFRNSLANEGIKSLQLMIYTKYPSSPAGLPCQTYGQCNFLVKTWGFTGMGMSTLFLFPFTQTEVSDENGATGQGVENPNSFFANHQIVEVGNKLYDPSYGTAPVGAGGAGETTLNLRLYAEKSLSGYCEKGATAYSCALPVAGRQSLAAEVENSTVKGESEETEKTQE